MEDGVIGILKDAQRPVDMESKSIGGTATIQSPQEVVGSVRKPDHRMSQPHVTLSHVLVVCIERWKF